MGGNREKVKYYVIYSRKSKFTGKGESVENQVEMCRNYIALHYGEIAAEQALVYEDEGFSGCNLERPQFQHMMKDAGRREFIAIVVYRLDRISRNIGDFAGLIEDLGNRGIAFISIKEQFDTDSPMGRAMMYIASVFSQLERETIAERIRDNMRELSKTGRWLGGNTPTGYISERVTSVTLEGRRKSAFQLKQVPEEIQLVEMIFNKFLETGSLTKTDQYLLESGYRTKRNNAFSRFAVKAILTNPVYMKADQEAYEYMKEAGVEELCAEKIEFDGSHGIMAYNRTCQRPGKTNQINPMCQWIIALGTHEGIIDGKKWIQVQNILNRNKNKAYRRERINEALLSGILYCGNCGGRMRPKLGRQMNGRGERIFSYVCTIKERSRCHLCNSGNIDGNTLDMMILQQIVEISGETSFLGTELEKARETLRMKKTDADKEVCQLEDHKRQIESDLKKLRESLPRYLGTAMESDITSQILSLHHQADAVQKHLQERCVQSETDNLTGFESLQNRIGEMAGSLEGLPPEQRRMVVRNIIRKAVWDGENVHLYFLCDRKFSNS